MSAGTITSPPPTPNIPEIKAALYDVRRDDQRASAIIVRLRRMFQKVAADAHDFDVNEALNEVFVLASAEAASRDVTLDSRLARTPLTVSGDRIQLQQVMLNLVVNGIESIAAAGSRERRVVGATVLLDQHRVEISIADSGAGISQEHLAHVFDPFFTTKEQGMGMGLSIARTIVEAHRGRIRAENQVGGGAIFYMTLPLAKTQ